MLTYALIFFVLAALLGAFLLTYVLQNKNTPKGIAIIHGSFGAAGLVALAFGIYQRPFLFLFFCVVALGGFTLITLDLSGKKIPHALALGHGLLAICGILFLVFTLF